MKLSDLSDSPYLASDDYAVGTIMPEVAIERIEWAEVPVPKSTKKQRRVVVFFKGASKGWVANKNVAREIARQASLPTDGIESTWPGTLVRLVVVGDVRRQDGTRGNAFRLHSARAAPKNVEAS